jgi:hypothetical protein
MRTERGTSSFVDGGDPVHSLAGEPSVTKFPSVEGILRSSSQSFFQRLSVTPKGTSASLPYQYTGKVSPTRLTAQYGGGLSVDHSVTATVRLDITCSGKSRPASQTNWCVPAPTCRLTAPVTVRTISEWATSTPPVLNWNVAMPASSAS